MGEKHTAGRAWLAWFAQQPQEWCAACRSFNEINPPYWWRGNCHHARAALASLPTPEAKP